MDTVDRVADKVVDWTEQQHVHTCRSRSDASICGTIHGVGQHPLQELDII